MGISQNGLNSLLSLYGGSLTEALLDNYDFEWDLSKFCSQEKSISKEDIKSQLMYFQKLAKKLSAYFLYMRLIFKDVNKYEDWYAIRKSDIQDSIGKQIIRYYEGNMGSALKEIYSNEFIFSKNQFLEYTENRLTLLPSIKDIDLSKLSKENFTLVKERLGTHMHN